MEIESQDKLTVKGYSLVSFGFLLSQGVISKQMAGKSNKKFEGLDLLGPQGGRDKIQDRRCGSKK